MPNTNQEIYDALVIVCEKLWEMIEAETDPDIIDDLTQAHEVASTELDRLINENLSQNNNTYDSIANELSGAKDKLRAAKQRADDMAANMQDAATVVASLTTILGAVA